jgi:hypothetical protein
MSTNNPFAKHTSNLFSSRGCDVDAALQYAQEVINASPEDQRAVFWTALMVVVNTAANAFTQVTGPSPAQEIAAAWVRELVAQEVDKHATGLKDKVNDRVTGWIDDNLDGKLDDWANNSLAFEDACDNRIERWIENNLDLSDQIESAINDMDLVVRVR